jgi:hypothetical protein
MHFEWNYGEKALVERLGFGKDLNEYFAKTLVQYAEPYTPMEKGNLRDAQRAGVSANNQRGYITYPGVSYADYQYFGNDSGWKRHTPGTTSRWLEYAWTIHKFQISGKVGAYRRWHSK